MSAAKKRAIFYRMDENVLAVLSLLTKGFFAVPTTFWFHCTCLASSAEEDVNTEDMV